jgi:hypothetical protein
MAPQPSSQPIGEQTGERRGFGVRTSQLFASLRTSGGGDDDACHLSLDPFRPRDLDSCPLASVLECDGPGPLSGRAGTRLGRRLTFPEVLCLPRIMSLPESKVQNLPDAIAACGNVP